MAKDEWADREFVLITLELLFAGMAPINLKQHLKKLGSARLSGLVGIERLKMIYELFWEIGYPQHRCLLKIGKGG